MPKQIYAIYDNVSEMIIGGLQLHSHAAPAIRTFGDIAVMQNSQIALHPNDFDLVLLGVLNDDTTITPAKEVVLTGANWVAAQQTPGEKQNGD